MTSEVIPETSSDIISDCPELPRPPNLNNTIILSFLKIFPETEYAEVKATGMRKIIIKIPVVAVYPDHVHQWRGY
jgi:hypothetical protein